MKNFTLLFVTMIFATLSFGQVAQPYPPFNVTEYDSVQSTGYYFFCPYKLSAYPLYPSGTQHQMILDGAGNVVYVRNAPGYFAGDFKVQPNGMMSYIGSGLFYLMDSTFTVVDSITTGNGVVFDLHDLQVLPQNHYLLLGMEDVVRDLSGFHIFLRNGTPGSVNCVVRGFVLQELDSMKNVVFEWHSVDHFAFDDVDEFWLTDTTIVDWTHSNAVEMDYDGNFLVSSRHFNEITKINRSDSSIVWRFGGKANDFIFIGDTMQFIAQHDCRRIQNGNLTLFDNGRGGNSFHFASSKEYELDEINMTATLVWSHREAPGEWSRSQGNTQRLQNGNTLTDYGNLLPTPIVFNVVDSLQNKVFEIVFPDSLISYRSFNFPTLPWLLNRPQITCDFFNGQYYLIADSGHAQYIWSTGDTTQSLAVTALGNFSVFVPRGTGGFISSELFTVTDLLDPCNLQSVDNHSSPAGFKVYPNPSSTYLIISSSKNLDVDFEVVDIIGRKVMSGKTDKSFTFSVDVNSLPVGLYTIRVGLNQQKFIKN